MQIFTSKNKFLSFFFFFQVRIEKLRFNGNQRFMSPDFHIIFQNQVIELPDSWCGEGAERLNAFATCAYEALGH